MKLKIGCQNCRGLSEGRKRLDVFKWIQRKNFNITILTDTHSCSESEQRFINDWGFDCSFSKFSSCASNSRGVAIFFVKNLKCVIHSCDIDLGGNYVILDVTINKLRLTLIALYGPNKDTPSFFNNMCEKNY